MADYKEKFDDLHRAAKRKARELDEKLGVSGIMEDASRVAGDAARKGAQTIANGAGQLRAEAEAFRDDPKLRENARRAADETKTPAKQFARRPRTRERSFATQPAPPVKKRDRFSTMRRAM